MYEGQYLEALIHEDHERMEAIKRLNSEGVYPYNDKTRDELTALFGQAYNGKCKS